MKSSVLRAHAVLSYTSDTAEHARCGPWDISDTMSQLTCQGRRMLQMKETPLIRCAHNGHYNMVKYLVEQGADVNAIDLVREQSGTHAPLPSCCQVHAWSVASALHMSFSMWQSRLHCT